MHIEFKWKILNESVYFQEQKELYISGRWSVRIEIVGNDP
jgi:hypothetical protein